MSIEDAIHVQASTMVYAGGGVGMTKPMQKRTFNEMISYFNRTVAEMEIGTKEKMQLLGMVTALGLAHEDEMMKVISDMEDINAKDDKAR